MRKDQPTPSAENELGQKLCEAILVLAANREWSEITVEDVAKQAGFERATFLQDFENPREFLAILVRRLHLKTLALMDNTGQTSFDRIFDYMMARIELLQQSRAAALSVRQSCLRDIQSARIVGSAMWHTIKEQAQKEFGTPTLLQVLSLYAAYNITLYTWIEDETPDLAPTMAALDRSLRASGRFWPADGSF